MREFPLVEGTCRRGRLVITETTVALRPVSGNHWRRYHWQVPREQVAGVSSYRGGYGRDLLIHTSDGQRLRAERVAPQQALPIISLLGHARMELPEEIPLAGQARPNRWVREGKLVITDATVAVKPRVLFFIRRKHHWHVPRNDVTGVLTTRHPGMRMRYDVAVLTKDGGQHFASNLSPDTVIAVTRQLGHTTGTPIVPEPVREDRAAVAFALPLPREAMPVGLWAVEDDGVWEIEPERGPQPTSSWRARVAARDHTVSMHFGTMAVVMLLCGYTTVMLLGGRAMATGASFAQRVAVPSSVQSGAAASSHSILTLGSLIAPAGSKVTSPPTLMPAPASKPGPVHKHR
jgi:hypothetical protein